MAIYKHSKNKCGLALIIAVITSTVAFSIGLSLLDIAIRQLALSNISRDSETAFHAAHAGVECARFHNISVAAPYEVPYAVLAPIDIPSCMGSTGTSTTESGDKTPPSNYEGNKALYEYNYTWGSVGQELCSSISVYRYHEPTTGPGSDTDGGGTEDNDGPDRSEEVRGLGNCPEGSTCTIIKSRGYSDKCSNIDLPDTIEREVVAIY